jgi:hypothetical protein
VETDIFTALCHRLYFSGRPQSWSGSFYHFTMDSLEQMKHNHVSGIQVKRIPFQSNRGLYFGMKTIPPPFWKWYFFPSRDTSFYDSHRGLFALILPYFAIILPFYFPFSHFLSPFFLFLLHFPPFSLRLFIFLNMWYRLFTNNSASDSMYDSFRLQNW